MGREEPGEFETPKDEAAEDARVTRRRAMKKAAAAAAVSGAVWVAPKVEGLSVVPDYAAALTGSVGPTLLIIDASGPGPTYGGSGCDGTATDYIYVPAQPEWTLNSANRVAGAPTSPTNPTNGPVVISRSIPGVGSPNATVTIEFDVNPQRADREDYPGLFDGNAPLKLADIDFSGIDPPFNNCRVEFANLSSPANQGNQWQACGAAENAGNTSSSGNDMWLGPQPYTNSPPAQRNPASGFNVELRTTVGPLFRDIQQIRLNVRCD